MRKRRLSENMRWLLGSFLVLLGLCGVAIAIVANSPKALIPRFLRGHESKAQTFIYKQGVHSIVRGGRVTYMPQILVTENHTFKLSGSFEEMLQVAEEELNADRGWDLSTVPKDQTATFYQRSTNTSVDVKPSGWFVAITVSQTRYATLADRLRQWWGKAGI